MDTNYLLNCNIDDEDGFYLSSITLEEIESIKTNRNKSDDVRYRARKVAKWLSDNESKYKVIVCTGFIDSYIINAYLQITPDNRICATAKYVKDNTDEDVVFCTGDINCANIAKHVFDLDIMTLNDGSDTIYKGYRTIRGTTSEINQIMNDGLNNMNVNEYLIIENTDDGSVKEMRYDGEQFVSLKLPPSKYIKGRNSLQRCALDMLMNPEITVCAVLGTYGSGKTYLAMQMSVYAVREKGRQSKILGVREIVGEGKEPGYLPGDLENKVGSFFDPLAQSLDGGVFELESLKQNGILETAIPHFMKGTTYNQTIIVCDEAEDLSESQIRLIGTRLGENSRIFLSGDFKQSLFNKTVNNPLVRMCNEFKGNKRFACICLDEDVRSETSKMFAELFK